jgi:hypothetical protein
MRKHFLKNILLFIDLSFMLCSLTFGKTVIFFEKNFPTVENSTISRQSLERAFSFMNPRFVNLADLQKNGILSEGDLLILPYGSALPADAWETIHHHLNKGHLLVLGGRPFFAPVYRDKNGWRIDDPKNTFARSLGIEHSYEAPQHGPWNIQWDEDAPWFHHTNLQAQRVFVNAGLSGRYRGIGFMVNERGDRLAAPLVADDVLESTQIPRRRVYLSFDAESEFWNSPNGIHLMKNAALYASLGGIRLWLDLQQLTVDKGGSISGSVDVLRNGEPAKITLELLSGSKILSERTMTCGNSLLERIQLSVPLNDPGLYRVRASLSIGDTLYERYTSGFFVRDTLLLLSGERLEAARDYFRLDGKPYLMTGTNYFGTDPYTTGFVFGNSLGGNAWIWEKDFTEMEQQGLTIVRTGIWVNRSSYISWVNGAPDERFLLALEAYLTAAAHHHMQVIFTFFAFDPQTEMQGQGRDGSRMGPGSNPYLDPIAIEAQLNYVRAIVSRFRNVPFLSFDIINEPSFCNPNRIWKGNSPNGDPSEISAWQSWLKKRYQTIDQLALVWRTTPSELKSFEKIPLPSFPDLEFSRAGNPRNVRAVDYNLFAQDAFTHWVNCIIQAIRSTGAQQAITVGQDEGGVADRVLNQFWARSQVSYTVNHSWWRDDALLWSSLAAKTLNKPNIIGETGPQPVSSIDGSWRWDDVQGMALLERKFALGFAGANAGILHWDWSRTDNFGIFRRDGSQKQWMDVLRGIAAFAGRAQTFTTEAQVPDIALVLPQSLQLSVLSGWGIFAQQNAVRALYQHARGTAFMIGEYQLSQMPEVKLIIVPSPWIMNQDAWNILMTKVQSGATLLISGRIDADEHWTSIPDRIRNWNISYNSTALSTREVTVEWPEGTAHLSYSGDKTTYAERGVLSKNQTFLDLPFGKGRILYFALPLELSDQLSEVGRIYKYVMKRADVNTAYETSCEDSGILICPTQLPDATLYVLTSESTSAAPITWKDIKSGKDVRVNLSPGRAALLLIGKDGKIITSYNAPLL